MSLAMGFDAIQFKRSLPMSKYDFALLYGYDL